MPAISSASRVLPTPPVPSTVTRSLVDEQPLESGELGVASPEPVGPPGAAPPPRVVVLRRDVPLELAQGGRTVRARSPRPSRRRYPYPARRASAGRPASASALSRSSTADSRERLGGHERRRQFHGLVDLTGIDARGDVDASSTACRSSSSDTAHAASGATPVELGQWWPPPQRPGLGEEPVARADGAVPGLGQQHPGPGGIGAVDAGVVGDFGALSLVVEVAE